MSTGIINVGLEEFLEDNVKDLAGTLPWMKGTAMSLCHKMEELSTFIDRAIQQKRVALDVETTGLNTRRKKEGGSSSELVGVSLALSANEGIYVPVQHADGKEFNLPLLHVLDEIKRLCKNCIIIVHNAKFDFQILRNYGIEIGNSLLEQYLNFDDTLILAHLYDAGSKDNKLKHLSEKILGRPMIEFSEATGGSHRFDFISPKIGYVYAVSDAMNTYALYEFFIQQTIVKEQSAIYNLEKRLVFVVMEMESNLVYIDREYLKVENIRVLNRIEEIKKEIYAAVGREFNVGSTQQLGKILFEELKYDYPERTKTKSGQYSTDNATLEKITSKYPLVKLVVEFRELEKAQGTYIQNLLNNCDADGCIKLSFKQTGTDTGRFSSPGGMGLTIDGYCGVNVQSIPSNYAEGAPDVRKAFRARPGKKLVAMDFSGEEYRVATNLSKETTWIEEFLHGKGDFHTATAKLAFGKNEVTKEERQTGKTLNFLILFGGGAQNLATQAHLSLQEAKRIIQTFFSKATRYKRWTEIEKAAAREAKRSKTDFGRIRPLHMFYDTDDDGLKAHADRCAVNFRIQGVCADIMKTVLVRLYNWIHTHNLQDEIKMLITMHDEIVFEIPENKLAEYIPTLNSIMCLADILQGILKWPVPLITDAEYGDSWHVDHDFFEEHPELKKIDDIQFYQTAPQTAVPVPATPIEEIPKPEDTARVQEPVIPESPVIALPEEELSTATISALVERSPEECPENFVFQINSSLTPSRGHLLNQVLLFCQEEAAKEGYSGSLKNLKLCDKDNNTLLVSDVKIRPDCFLALARYLGL
jgi:DNA polymerase-1